MSIAQFLCEIWLSDVGIHSHVIGLPSCKYVKSLWTSKQSYLIIRQRKNRNPGIRTHEKIEGLFTEESCNPNQCIWKKIFLQID